MIQTEILMFTINQIIQKITPLLGERQQYISYAKQFLTYLREHNLAISIDSKETFLESERTQGKSQSTINATETVIRKILIFCKKEGISRLKPLKDKVYLVAYKDFLESENRLQERTKNIYRQSVQNYIEFLYENDFRVIPAVGVLSFKEYIRTNNTSDSWLSLNISAVKDFYNFIVLYASKFNITQQDVMSLKLVQGISNQDENKVGFSVQSIMIENV